MVAVLAVICSVLCDERIMETPIFRMIAAGSISIIREITDIMKFFFVQLVMRVAW